MATDAPTRLARAIEQFDAVNGQDPRIMEEAGVALTVELLYAERMTTWLARFEPAASEELQLAARAQHIARWQVPRSDYPEGRTGYLAWRSALSEHHARTAAKILRQVGYDESTAERVASLIRKHRLKVDAEAQALEDVVCLVFVAHYLEDFSAQRSDEMLVEIIRKTLRKMSARGRAAALEIESVPRVAALMQRALGPWT